MTSAPGSSKLRLAASTEDAVKAVLDALPKDAIVREEDDGIGRFAGNRLLVIVARGRARLAMFQGTYGSIKARLETPHLDVTFAQKKKGLVVRLTPETIAKPTLASHAWSFLANVVTVGALVVAYFFVRRLPVDTTMTALVALGGGAAWSAIAHFMPKTIDRRLERIVHDALEPMSAPK